MVEDRDATAEAVGDGISRAVGAYFAAHDAFAKSLGIELAATGPGHARVTMTVGAHMTNPSGNGHGGALFTLADTAFGYACNSRNAFSVGTHCTITYLAPVQVGDMLTAEAGEVILAGRDGVYDVTVRNEKGQVVALYRGQSRRLRGALVPGLAGETES